MHGILLVDKPEGVTSADVVRVVKRVVKPSKVGHSGTLDPAASGLLVILIGAATRFLDFLNENVKRYLMTVRFGEETDTCDREGTVISVADPSGIRDADIRRVTAGYIGKISQIPPHFSALKKNGSPLYKLARQGVFPEIAPRPVEVYSWEMTSLRPPCAELDLVCSKGTYARSLARDIGRDLGVGARLEALRRTQSGKFVIEDSIPMKRIRELTLGELAALLIPPERALAHLPLYQATSAEALKITHGSAIPLDPARLSNASRISAGCTVCVTVQDGSLLALAEPRIADAHTTLQPTRVFHLTENV